jgi:hypothetical protein
MTENLRLIARQLAHVQRMREYLEHSIVRCMAIIPVADWKSLSLEGHEVLAAFRVRFSEFQEHLGKAMRAVASEEEIEIERFGTVLAFMEKIGVLESAERWKIIREIRNAISHEYEEDSARLNEFFGEMLKAAPELFGSHRKLLAFCQKSYDLKPE